MTVTILDSIPFTIDGAEVLSQLQFPVAGLEEEVEPLLQAARAIARPKAMYREAFVEARAGRHVVIDGVRLTSRILSVNLERIDRVFPFVVTCGAELEAWSETITDPFLRYWADAIKELALSAAYRALDAHLAERYGLDHLATMNPGSLADWPIEQQPLLFALLGDPQQAIGVHLTESYLMVPTKSVSGIHFPPEDDYVNCALCQREACPNRRAPFEPELFERRYGEDRGVRSND